MAKHKAVTGQRVPRGNMHGGAAKKEKKGSAEEICIDGTSVGKTCLGPGTLN